MGAKNNGQLFVQHVEGLDRDLVSKHKQFLKKFIQGKHGVYALYYNNRLVYVGLASDLRSRLYIHLKDRHATGWNTFSVYLTKSANHMRELEALLIRIAKPVENRQTGRLATSVNLKPHLIRMMTLHYRNEVNRMCGVPIKTIQVTNNSQQTRLPPLKGIFHRQELIQFIYKGKTHKATVFSNGKVRFSGRLFNSPSMAGQYITKRATNGWKVWKYENKKGLWVPIDGLRK